MLFPPSLVTLVVFVAVAYAGPVGRKATVCNGRSELCSRSYGAVTFVGAHNSFAVSTNPVSVSANQNVDVTAQLNLGVRLLQGGTKLDGSSVKFCHTSCILYDGGLLVNYLKKVKTWLDANPNEVITILLTNPDALDVGTYFTGPFTDSGIASLAYIPPTPSMSRSAWPTLGTLIDSGKRVIVFMDYHTNTNAVPYILPEFDNIWETPFSVTDSSFPCSVDRVNGAPEGKTYMINHSLNVNIFGIIIPDRNSATTTNSQSSIIAHVNRCKALSASGGLSPGFLLLDWVDKGQAFAAANALNGF